MSVGSISAGLVAAAYGPAQPKPDAPGAAAPERRIADHVAAADGDEPIRSVSATLGTLVDTYL
jgi:hypothetical protein